MKNKLKEKNNSIASLIYLTDPEVCDYGFTVQMTVKIYRGSVLNDERLFIMDSGATLNNSRGISLWVNHGKLSGAVVTRENTWCIRRSLYPYIEKWISLTFTWNRDIGSICICTISFCVVIFGPNFYCGHFTNICKS